jgi:hypothetical protein
MPGLVPGICGTSPAVTHYTWSTLSEMCPRLSMRTVRFWICCIGLLAIDPARAQGISGTYVGRATNGAFLLQIVQTIDGRLTGRYSQTILRADGRLEELNASVSGASDGHTVALTMRPAEFLSGEWSLSGTVARSSLRLTGGGYGTALSLDLTKSEEGDFRAYTATLASQGQRSGATRALEQAVVSVGNVTKEMKAFLEQAPVQLTKFDPIEERFRQATRLMREALVRQQSIRGEGQASVARSQIAVAINQVGIQANQIRISVQSAYADFDSRHRSLQSRGVDAQKTCQTASINVDDRGTSLLPKWNSVCLDLAKTVPEFGKTVSALRDAFARTESVWQEERAKQEPIVRSADATE